MVDWQGGIGFVATIGLFWLLLTGQFLPLLQALQAWFQADGWKLALLFAGGYFLYWWFNKRVQYVNSVVGFDTALNSLWDSGELEEMKAYHYYKNWFVPDFSSGGIQIVEGLSDKKIWVAHMRKALAVDSRLLPNQVLLGVSAGVYPLPAGNRLRFFADKGKLLAYNNARSLNDLERAVHGESDREWSKRMFERVFEDSPEEVIPQLLGRGVQPLELRGDLVPHGGK